MLQWTLVCIYLIKLALSRKILGNEIAGLYSNSMFSFYEDPPYCLLQWQHQFAFPLVVHRGFLYLLTNTYYLFLLLAIMIGVRWYLVVLIHISLMISDIEHLFMCLSAICKSLQKYLFMSYSVGLSVFCCRVVWVLCTFWMLTPYYIVCMLSCVWLFVTPWTTTHQAPVSMEFSRQEYWTGLPFSIPEDLPNPGIKPTSPKSPASGGGFFTTVPPGKSPLLCTSFTNIFSHSLGCLFILLRVSFTVQKFFSWILSHVFIFAFVSVAWGDRSKIILLRLKSKKHTSCVSSRSFMVFGLTHSEFIFVYDVRK